MIIGVAETKTTREIKPKQKVINTNIVGTN